MVLLLVFTQLTRDLFAIAKFLLLFFIIQTNADVMCDEKLTWMEASLCGHHIHWVQKNGNNIALYITFTYLNILF